MHGKIINLPAEKFHKNNNCGYQFTSIKYQNSIYRKPNQKFNPDFVLTTGKISEAIIKEKLLIQKLKQ